MERQEEQIFPADDELIFPIEDVLIFPAAETDREQEIRLLKEKALKVKVIALDQLRKPIFSNPSLFTNREKAKVLKVMTEMFDKPDDEIDGLFNDIVLDTIENNYERIYINPMNVTYAPDPEFHRNLPPMDIVGNTINPEISTK